MHPGQSQAADKGDKAKVTRLNFLRPYVPDWVEIVGFEKHQNDLPITPFFACSSSGSGDLNANDQIGYFGVPSGKLT